MTFAAAEADRRIEAMIQIGRVTAVDGAGATATVELGAITLPAVQVCQLRAGVLSFWWMPSPNEQVLVLSPGGDMARALVVCSIFAGNAPSADTGTPLIELAGGVLKLNGSLEATGDVIAGGISLVNHVHPGVDPGPATTGAPQ